MWTWVVANLASMLKFGRKMHLMNGNNSMGMNMSIIDLSKKEESVKGLVDMFCLFALQVVKKDNNVYLPTKFFFLILLFFFQFCLFLFFFKYLVFQFVICVFMFFFPLTFFFSFMATFKHWQTDQEKVEPKDYWIYYCPNKPFQHFYQCQVQLCENYEWQNSFVSVKCKSWEVH